MEENSNIIYNSTDYIVSKINENIDDYLAEVIGNTQQKVKNKIASWTTKISDDIIEFQGFLGKEKWKIFEQFPQVFKDNNFKKLWTVNAALTTPDPELKRYQDAYNNMPGEDMFKKFKEIVLRAEKYFVEIGTSLDYYTVKSVEDLQQDFFNDEEMFLKGVIGLGIRSEFLLKFFPATFTLMTRRSHWAMYILTNSEEFILQQKGYGKYRGKIRYVNQFQYDYPRFSFYNIIVLEKLIEYCQKFDVSIDEKYRFGYINLLLSDIHEFKKDAVEELKKWEKHYE